MWFFKKKRETEQDILIKRIKAEQLDMQDLFSNINNRSPTRLPHPWDSPGKNTGVGCHFLLQCMKRKSESEVTQLCPTVQDPVVCSLPGSSVHGLFPGKSTGVGCHCYYIRILRGPVHTHGFRVHVLSNAMLTVNMQFPISNIRSIYWLTIVICILF